MSRQFDKRILPHCPALPLFILCGCVNRQAPQAADYLPPSNEVVTAYGVTLDENETPEQTVWVLLMAIRDDVRTKINTPQWQKLMKLQCRLANIELLRSSSAVSKRASREKSEEIFFKVVKGWAPALNYYAEHFDDTLEAAMARMSSRSDTDKSLPEDNQTIQVVDYVLTAQQSDSPAGLNSGVTIRFRLSKTQKGYWRVYKLILGPPPAPTN